MNRFLFCLILLTGCTTSTLSANGITHTAKSPYARMTAVPLGDVHWSGGFWGERYEIFKDTMILSMWRTLNTPEISHSYRNFEIAAGYEDGAHWGPPFHDGDFYKWLEGVAAVYAVTREPALDKLMDEIIGTITRVQRKDGYIHTPVVIAEKNKGIDSHSGEAVAEKAFENRLNFETYNLGHLMMAGIIHHRATGKRTLLDVAVKATDFLCYFYETATAELARNAICPSHYMGVTEMYRTTGNPRYLELANNLIDIRGMVENGTDDNQDRVPFREQTRAMGHAVRANYLYAGVADLYAETGEKKLLENLESIWLDIVHRKMYITGACGALYDGTSPDGTNYTPDSIQKVHQSYGRAFQLPNSTAHNETCANIGNMLFNWRMLQVSGDARYADILETALYNSVLSGVSLDGKRFFYTNPLRISNDFPYTLRWPKERQEYISCFCCPPNTVRTLVEAQNYSYSLSDEGVWCHLYGGSELHTPYRNGHLKIKQNTNYPWEGTISLSIEEVPEQSDFAIKLRIPAWFTSGTLKINGKKQAIRMQADSYAELKQNWKSGDAIELELDMQVQLLESNPLAEETRNQVVVKRGPIVYCLEGTDTGGSSIDDILIPSNIQLKVVPYELAGSKVMALEGRARVSEGGSWKNALYRRVTPASATTRIRLIPYYAWGNREKTEMTVWMPLVK